MSLRALVGDPDDWTEVDGVSFRDCEDEPYGDDLIRFESTETIPGSDGVVGTAHYFVRPRVEAGS